MKCEKCGVDTDLIEKQGYLLLYRVVFICPYCNQTNIFSTIPVLEYISEAGSWGHVYRISTIFCSGCSRRIDYFTSVCQPSKPSNERWDAEFGEPTSAIFNMAHIWRN